MHTHREYFDALFAKLAIKPASIVAARRACAIPSIFESSEGNNGWNNPLACALKWPNSTPLYPNAPDGAQRYATFTDGVDAMAQRMSGPAWAPVRQALATATWRDPILDAFSEVYAEWAHVNFRALPYNNVSSALHRLDHVLYGPCDPGSWPPC